MGNFGKGKTMYNNSNTYYKIMFPGFVTLKCEFAAYSFQWCSNKLVCFLHHHPHGRPASSLGLSSARTRPWLLQRERGDDYITCAILTIVRGLFI